MPYLCRIGLPLAFTALALGSPAGGHAAGAAQEKVYVTVTDNKGKPIAGLTAADFKVDIDGTAQEIQSAAPATDPVSVVIITDRLGLEPAYNNFVVHHALSGFVKAVRAVPDSQFALTTFDGPVVRISGFSGHAAAFDKSLEKLATNATEAAMLDAVLDACDVLKGAKTDRKAIFAAYAGYRRDASTGWNNTAAMALWQSKASLWAIEVRSTGAENVGSAGREQVVHQGSRMSGGMSETVASAIGLDTMARRMGELIAKQYVITYGPGGSGTTASRRQVSVGRAGLKVLAPTWAPR